MENHQPDMGKIVQSFPLQRLPTGVRGLDSILKGGFFSGGIYVIAGMPGTGKTVLANQICYNHVAAGGRAAFVSVLSESHSRMFGHLHSQSYFDPAVVSHELLYVSAFQVLEEEGLPGFLKVLGEVLSTQQATLLVIDGLLTSDTIAPWDADYQKFIQGLQSVSELMGTTTILLSKFFQESDGRRPQRSQGTQSQHTIVDGIIELEDTEMGTQAIRELSVKKFRGSGYLRGRHTFQISDDGLVVYPRTEKLYQVQSPPEAYSEKKCFGIPEFDKTLEGGVLRGSTTMMLGAPGSGKTLFGLHFLAEGARNGEPGLYMGFDESPKRVAATADGVGLAFSDAVKEGLITMLWQLPIELYPDAVSELLIDTVKKHGIKRLFLDGLSALIRATVYPERVPALMAALTNLLRCMDVTTIFTLETHAIMAPSLELPIDGISVLVENMILLGHVEYASRVERQITILKVRQHGFDPAIRRFTITPRGVKVGEPFTNASGLLSGQAHPAAYQPSKVSEVTHESEAYEDSPGH